MNITFFNRKYVVRRFSEQQNVNGYLVSGYSDFTASLHVHPLGTDQMQALPEGLRNVDRLEAHGTDVLRAADEERNIRGDMLWYNGAWFECVSAVSWDHTMLSHLNYQFVRVPPDGSGSAELGPPTGI